MTAKPPPLVWVTLLALVGGAAGVLGAMYKEATAAPMLVIVLVGPAIEEIMKPIAVVFLLDKRPHWLRGPGHTLAMAVLGALVFATLENLMYIFVYAPQFGAGYRVYRFTVCTAMHVGATGVFAVGLGKMWRHIRDKGGHFDIDVCFRYYVAAVAIHAAYNTVAVILSATGVLRFS